MNVVTIFGRKFWGTTVHSHFKNSDVLESGMIYGVKEVTLLSGGGKNICVTE